VTDGSHFQQARDEWKRQLEPTLECIPIDRLGDELTPDAREHVAHCVRCQTEMALWREYENAETAPAEGAAVQWIADETRRRMNAARVSRHESRGFAWLPAVSWRPFAAVAAAVAALAVIYVAQNREPVISDVATGDETYRTASIVTISPIGDLAAAPTELQWHAMAAAAQYDAQVEEVDGTVLWRASTPNARIELPGDVIAQCVPGKTLRWRIAARDAHGAIVAESAVQPFRVRAKPTSGGN